MVDRTPNETVPRQFRLSEETLEQLDRISTHYGLRSRADAIRIAARQLVDSLPVSPPPKRKSRNPKKTT